VNLTQIQAQCGLLLGDPNNDTWAASVLTTRANLLQTEIEGITNAVKTAETLTPVTSTRTVSLNANTMNIVRASKTLSDGSIRPLQLISREELDFLYPDWQQWQDGEPLYALYDATAQTLAFIPKPSSVFAITNGVTAWEIRKPADLSGASDIPFDSNNQMVPYHMAIVHGVVALCFADVGTPEALGKAKYHRSGNMMKPGEFENHVGRIMSEFDVPEAVPSRILFMPQGGRVGGWGVPSKSNPLPF
jgi:hypothetical protein